MTPAKFFKGLGIFFISLIVLLGLTLIAIPHVAGAVARHALAKNPTYDGDFKDLDVHLFDGRVTLNGLILKKKGQKEGEPFIKTESASGKIYWKPLIKKKIIGEMLIVNPEIHVVAHAVEEEQQKTKEAVQNKNIVQIIEDLMPFRVDRFEIRGGTVSYVNPTAQPQIKLDIDGIHFVAENLTNRQGLSDKMPARAKVSMRIMKSGALAAKTQFDPFAKDPLFNLDFRLKDLDLRSMNSFIRYYSMMDVAQGELSMSAEVASKGKDYEGYIKPLLKNFEMRSKGEKDESVFTAIKEWTVEKIEHLFENDDTKAAGTRVPFTGSYKTPSVDVWSAIVEVFRNAFVRALSPGVEGKEKLGDPKK